MASKNLKGSITIYTTLIFTVIAALVLVLTESARFSYAKSTALSKTVLSCDSMLGGYDRNIYDNYRIFAYDIGTNNKSEAKDKIKKELKNYIALEQGIYQKGFGKVILKDLRVKEMHVMTADNTDLFIDEAVEYMKYKTPVDLSAHFLDMLGILSSNKKTLEIVKCKSAVESKMYDCQDMLLELLQQVDGVCCEYNTFARTEDGDIIPCEKFAKLVVAGLNGKESVGINNEFVFSCMESSYYDIEKEMDKLINKLEWLVDNFKKYDEESDKVYDECYEIIGEIEENSGYCYDSIENALAFIDKLKGDALEVEIELEAFNNKLASSKDNIELTLYEELKKENEELLEQPLSNLPQIEKRLKANEEIIIKLKEINKCGYEYNQKGINKACEYIKNLKDELKGYRVDDIVFDYSKVKREKPVQNDVAIKGLKAIIDEGVARICITNYDGLSKSRLADSGLVSLGLESANSSNLATRVNRFFTSTKSSLSELVEKFMDSLEGELSIDEFLSSSAASISRKLLFGEYIDEYFTSLVNTKANNKLTHSLAYEQEYIIAGQRSDRGNIKTVVKRILGVRIAVNLICILCNTSTRTQAHGLAASVTGLAGIPIITYLASTIIQIVWAYEEAIVDTCAICQGRYVPLIKTASNLKVPSVSVFTFGKPTIEMLAKTYTKTDSVADFGYGEYLKMFIVLMDDKVAAARTMDLIQSNINRNYDKRINFSRMLYGWEVEVEYEIQTLFLDMKFIQAVLKNKSKERYMIRLSYNCSY